MKRFLRVGVLIVLLPLPLLSAAARSTYLALTFADSSHRDVCRLYQMGVFVSRSSGMLWQVRRIFGSTTTFDAFRLHMSGSLKMHLLCRKAELN